VFSRFHRDILSKTEEHNSYRAKKQKLFASGMFNENALFSFPACHGAI